MSSTSVDTVLEQLKWKMLWYDVVVLRCLQSSWYIESFVLRWFRASIHPLQNRPWWATRTTSREKVSTRTLSLRINAIRMPRRRRSLGASFARRSPLTPFPMLFKSVLIIIPFFFKIKRTNFGLLPVLHGTSKDQVWQDYASNSTQSSSQPSRRARWHFNVSRSGCSSRPHQPTRSVGTAG